jgi:hypothetical protein
VTERLSLIIDRHIFWNWTPWEQKVRDEITENPGQDSAIWLFNPQTKVWGKLYIPILL